MLGRFHRDGHGEFDRRRQLERKRSPGRTPGDDVSARDRALILGLGLRHGFARSARRDFPGSGDRGGRLGHCRRRDRQRFPLDLLARDDPDGRGQRRHATGALCSCGGAPSRGARSGDLKCRCWRNYRGRPWTSAGRTHRSTGCGRRRGRARWAVCLVSFPGSQRLASRSRRSETGSDGTGT